MKQRFLMVFAMFIGMLSATACSQEKGNEPEGDKLIVANIKYEVSIKASEKVKINFIVTKGFEPNIYQDGKLVSQGNYDSDDIETDNIQTTFTHKGQALVFGIIVNGFHDVTSPDATVLLHVKTYQDDKLIHDFSKERKVGDGFNEQFTHYAKPLD